LIALVNEAEAYFKILGEVVRSRGRTKKAHAPSIREMATHETAARQSPSPTIQIVRGDARRQQRRHALFERIRHLIARRIGAGGGRSIFF